MLILIFGGGGLMDPSWSFLSPEVLEWPAPFGHSCEVPWNPFSPLPRKQLSPPPPNK